MKNTAENYKQRNADKREILKLGRVLAMHLAGPKTHDGRRAMRLLAAINRYEGR